MRPEGQRRSLSSLQSFEHDFGLAARELPHLLGRLANLADAYEHGQDISQALEKFAADRNRRTLIYLMIVSEQTAAPYWDIVQRTTGDEELGLRSELEQLQARLFHPVRETWEFYRFGRKAKWTRVSGETTVTLPENEADKAVRVRVALRVFGGDKLLLETTDDVGSLVRLASAVLGKACDALEQTSQRGLELTDAENVGLVRGEAQLRSASARLFRVVAKTQSEADTRDMPTAGSEQGLENPGGA